MQYDTSIDLRFRHRFRFTCSALDAANPALRACFDGDDGDRSEPARVLPFVDAGLLEAMPDLRQQLTTYFEAHRRRLVMAGDIQSVPGGEACKNDPQAIDAILSTMHRANLDRRGYVLVIGGGAVLDAVGFAASIAHRGVRLVRMPSTTLSQCDSGVGVKNGINYFGQKNYLGTFAVPDAVLNDPSLLTALHERDWRSGFSELVKVALLKDAALFEQICQHVPAVRARDLQTSAPLLRRAAELHFEHIVHGGDPFERGAGRPLDFGHWAAHKLETLSDFELHHGEAVAIGLAIDVTYSERIGLLPPTVAQRIRACLQDLGFELYHPACDDHDAVIAGLEEFRSHLGGALCVPMIEQIAQPIDVHELDYALLAETIQALRHSAPHSATINRTGRCS